MVNGLIYTRTNLTFINQNTDYNIRSGTNIAIPQVSTTKYGINSTVYYVIKSFNEVPLALRNLPNYVCTFQNSVTITYYSQID